MKTFLSVILAFALVGALIWLTSDQEEPKPSNAQDNVSVTNGKQIVRINAKGGYWPRQTLAKANLLTTIKIKTNGTFDCSSALVIPSLGYRYSLPPTGEIEIRLPEQKPGSVIQGICAMGMYNFTINFN